MKSALIIPARNEGALLAETIEAHRGAVDTVYVVADRDSGNAITTAKRFGCEYIEQPAPTLGRDRWRAGGPGRGRRIGLAQAHADGHDIGIVSDAHTRPVAGSLSDLARMAGFGGMWQAACTPWREDCRDAGETWVKVGSTMKQVRHCHYYENGHKHVPTLAEALAQPPIVQSQHVYGSVYAAKLDVWEQFDYYLPTLSWGYNEQALTLCCLALGIPIYATWHVVCEHWFKRTMPAVQGEGTTWLSKLNRAIVHYSCCDDDEWPDVLAGLREDNRRAMKHWPAIIAACPEIEPTRQRILAARVCTWPEIVAQTVTPEYPLPLHPSRESIGNVRHVEKPVVVAIIAPGRPEVLRMWRGRVKRFRDMFSDVVYIDSSGGMCPVNAPEATVIPGVPPLPELPPGEKHTAMDRAQNQADNWQLALEHLRYHGVTAPILSWEPDVIPSGKHLAEYMRQASRYDGITSCPVRARHRRHYPTMLYADRSFRNHAKVGQEFCAACHLGLTYLPAAIWQAWTPRTETRAHKAAVDHCLTEDFPTPVRIVWMCRPRHHWTVERWVTYGEPVEGHGAG